MSTVQPKAVASAISADEDDLPLPPLEPYDWFLGSLVRIVTSSRISIGVTLNVGGSLISGDLVSGREYFENVGREFNESLGRGPDAPGLFDDLAAVYKGQDDEQEEATKVVTQYIHLRGAKMYHPGQQPIPANRGIWWRGRLSAIDGFALGKLETSR